MMQGTKRSQLLRAQGRAGFTLIELLVVIAVIALLLSILLPSLAGARETARTTQCLSNVRQLAVAATTHASDFKGLFSTGPFDDRGSNGYGYLNEVGWVADYVKGGYAVPGKMLCPSSPSRASQALSASRLTNPLYASSVDAIGQLVADGYNTNYCQSWYMAYTAPKEITTVTPSQLKNPLYVVGPLNERSIVQTSPDKVPLFGDGTTQFSQSDDVVMLPTGQVQGSKTVTDGPTTAFVPGRGAVAGRQNYTDLGPAHGKGGFVGGLAGHDRVYGTLAFGDGHAASFTEKRADREWGHTSAVVNGISTIRYDELEGQVFGGWLNRPGLPF